MRRNTSCWPALGPSHMLRLELEAMGDLIA